jgi:ABC-type multidrug transport system fused ATPase/permease subunit
VLGPDGEPLLDRVRLSLPGGTTVAVVGPSGAGKSVLAAVAARLRDPDSGQIRLDGIPLPALGREALRTGVGVAFERPVPVGATVADAIGLGSADGAEQAARATHAHRAATAARADPVVWLGGGRVRGAGPHRVLWQQQPAYREALSFGRYRG